MVFDFREKEVLYIEVIEELGCEVMGDMNNDWVCKGFNFEVIG